MNKKAKDMFDKLHEYCTDNGYQIIEVYFQDDEALLLDNFSRTRFVAIYEDGYWEEKRIKIDVLRGESGG